MRAAHATWTFCGLWVALTTLAMAGAPASLAQDRTPPADEAERAVLALTRALEERMTVWRSTSRVFYVQHCRAAQGGCPERVSTFARMMGEAARQHRLDPFLLAAVAVRESGMNPLAAGRAGERGIVQLHPRGPGGGVQFVRSETYRARCARQPGVCQEEVLREGARLLSRAIERCGGVRSGLGAYNSGSCGQTDYARHVMSERQRLLRLAKGTAS